MISYTMARDFSIMYQFCFVILLNIVLTDGTIFCQDKNAGPWRALGISCPVNCDNVLYAIETLKMFDYKTLLSKDVVNKNDLSSSGSSKQVFSSDETHLRWTNGTGNDGNDRTGYRRKTFDFKKKRSKYDKFKVMFEVFTKLLKGKVLIDLQTELATNLISNITEHKCSLPLKKAAVKRSYLKHYFKKCARRSNDEREDFLTVLTDILNKHSTTVKFNLEMTKILLQKLLGTSMDLRNGIFDVRKILKYLQMAIEEKEKEEIEEDRASPLTLSLRSTHCLTAYVAGCSCRSGYVEMAGRCVKPTECTNDAAHYKYIERIIVY